MTQRLVQLARAAAVLATAATLVSGCAFVEAATEQTIGEGQIPRFDEEILYPAIDDLTGLTADQSGSIPGFPTSLNNATFAHLQGAFAITGECSKSLAIEGPEDNEALVGIEVTVTNCTQDLRCAHICEEGFFGMMFEARVELLLLTKEKADKLRNLLSELTPDAIAQIRLQFFELQLFQTDEDGERFEIHDSIDDFWLGLENADGDRVVFLEGSHLDVIDPEDPQRFDIDAAAEFTIKLKDDVLAADEVSAFVVQSMRIPQPNLYELVFDGAGLQFDLQPEFVISVLEVVQSKL